MSSLSTEQYTLNIPATPCAPRGFPPKRTRRFSNGETIVMNPECKQDQLRRITSILESEDLSTEERLYWETRLFDVWKAPTQPPQGAFYFFLPKIKDKK